MRTDNLTRVPVSLAESGLASQDNGCPRLFCEGGTMAARVTVDEKAKTLTVVLDLQAPAPSASGKTLVVASTHGNMASTAVIDGKPVIVGVNAYIRKG